VGWVRNHYDPGSKHVYDTVEGKLSLIERIVQEKRIEPNETWKLQSLGITFGDALAQKLNLHWVMVEDEYGRDPALHDSGTTIILFPLTSISNRIERGETVDVRQLFEGACQTVARVRKELLSSRSR
jgi:hypothetical protein